MQHQRINNLITKYFYRNNHLCFQILLKMENNETVAYKEYADYAAYKHDFSRFKEIITQRMPFNFRGKLEKSSSEKTKMA